MNKSPFLLYVNQKDNNSFNISNEMIDQIFTKLNNNKVKYLILSDYKYNNIIIDNYKENFNKFLNFIREFELRLKNEFKYNYNLYIRLDFQMKTIIIVIFLVNILFMNQLIIKL